MSENNNNEPRINDSDFMLSCYQDTDDKQIDGETEQLKEDRFKFLQLSLKTIVKKSRPLTPTEIEEF